MPFKDTDYNILMLALAKCKMLGGFTRSGKYKLCVLAEEHIKLASQRGYILMVLPYGFPELSSRDYKELMKKLSDASDVAWLQQQRVEEEGPA